MLLKEGIQVIPVIKKYYTYWFKGRRKFFNGYEFYIKKSGPDLLLPGLYYISLT